MAEHVARFSGGSLRRAGIIAITSLAAVFCLGPHATAASQPATSTSLAHQAVDIQESPTSYTVTLDIPAQDASHLHVNLKGRTLRISSGQTSGGATFEQRFHLPEADALASPSITQDNGRIVISVAKAAPGSNPAPTSLARNFPAIPPTQAMPSISTSSGSMDAWARQAISQMAQMQRQMNAMLNSSMQADPFSAPMGAGFGGGVTQSGGGVSVEDKGQDYVIRAKGIDQSTKLDVSVDNGNLLKITSRNESSSNNGSSASSYQMSSSTQIVTLPSPVQSDKMTTRRDGDDVLITLPKA